MRAKVVHLCSGIRSSFWFLPALINLSVILLSRLTIFFDSHLAAQISGRWFVFSADAEAVRDVLSTIASSTITVTGVVFSITVVVLTLAASQLSPLLLRNFTRDTGNQFVLGFFIATYLYNLLILLSIRDGKNNGFIPYLSVTIGVFMAVFSLAVLIYFIHHMTVSIQGDYVVGLAGKDLEKVIAGLPDNRRPDENDGRRQIKRAQEQADEIRRGPFPVVSSGQSGYIQSIDIADLLKTAEQNDTVFLLEHRPGEYVLPATVFVTSPSAEKAKKKTIQNIKDCFVIGSQRTPEQDIEFAINQLVDVALHALSPSLNNTFTALTCIDRLSSALQEFSGKADTPPYVFDKKGRLRLIVKQVSFQGASDAAFNQIRQSGCDKPAVTIRLLERIRDVIVGIRNASHKKTLFAHASVIRDTGYRSAPARRDRRDIAERYRAILQATR